MRLLQWPAAVALAGVFASEPLAAQDTLRVLRHTPGDSAAPTSIVTISFDRPIAGAPDKAPSPARLFHIAPNIPGTLEWRDPITIRFTPATPLEPGARYTVTIDTAVRASDGARLGEPYRFTFRVRGPRLLARSIDPYATQYADTLAPNAHVSLLFSAPVDLDRLQRGVRLEVTGCPTATTIVFNAVRQRPLQKSDPDNFNWASGYPRDSISNAFRRVVELEPLAPVPVECAGKLVIPTMVDDSSFGREERYSVRTAPIFKLRRLVCVEYGPCVGTQVVFSFSSPVKRADALEHVTINGKSVDLLTGAEISKVWVLKAHLDPRSIYTVAVDTAMRDAYGRELEGPRSLALSIDDHAPQVMHAVGVVTAPSAGPHSMPLQSVNARSVRIIAYRIPDSARIRAMSMAPGIVNPPVIVRGLKPETTVVELPDRLNADTTTDIPLPPLALAPDHPLIAMRVEVRDPLPDATPPSASAARHATVLSWPERNQIWYWPLTLLQVTDLAVTTRLVGRTDGTAIVTGLGDGKPRANVTVTQLDAWSRVVGRGVSDKNGVAHLTRVAADTSAAPRTQVSLTPTARFSILQAESRDDRVIVSLGGGRAIGYQPGSPLDLSKLGARSDESPLVAGAVFSERGIYRPDEVVHVKGVVREGLLGDLRLPAHGDSARLTIRKKPNSWADDTTLTVRDTVVRMSAFGTVVDSVRLRPGLPLGEYEMDLKTIVAGEWRTIRTSKFDVAEYRTPEFVVELKPDTAARFIGDTIALHLQAQYYFGAAMNGAAVKWSADVEDGPIRIKIPGAAGWTIGNWTWYEGSGVKRPEQVTGTATLDANGGAEIRVATDAWPPALSGAVSVAAAVTDVSRQVGGAQAIVPFYSSREFILARIDGKNAEWRVGEQATVDLRVVDLHGSPIRDAAVQALVAHERFAPGNPTTGEQGRWVTDTISIERLRTNAGAGKFSFAPRLDGSYVVAFSTTDSHGTRIETAIGKSIRGPATSGEARAGFRLVLTADKPRLKTGEISRVHFDSPFDDADAWITIEREGILDQWRQRARRGNNAFDVRAVDRYAPNVFASVVLVARDDPEVRPDTSTDRLRAGYIELNVATDPKMLSVAVETDRGTYAPRDTATIRVHVRDAARQGVHSEVALWAVDEGVLALTGFTTPDILPQVYSPRGVGDQLWSTLPTMLTTNPSLVSVFLNQSAMYLSEMVAFSASTVAANAAITVSRARRDFSSTPFYLGQVETNGRGDAVAHARLPDNLTTFRVMAVAVSDGDRYGHGDTTLLVTRPLVARAALPRFIRPTDSLVAGVVVTPRDGKPRSVTADLSADGLGIRSPARMSISLSSGASAEARFVVKAPARDAIADVVSVRLGATDGLNEDATEMRLPVRPDYSPRTHAVLGAVSDSQDVAIVLPGDIDPHRSRMRLRIGTSSLSAMLAAYKWLRAYRFDCTEQIASTGRALVAVWEATKRERSDALGGDPREKLQELVGEISRRQRYDGAFMYWPPLDWSSPWLTAHAGMFLLDARATGAVVDPGVIARAGDYLRHAADAPIATGGMNRYEQRERRLALGERVAAVEYLRRAGTPDTVAENRLLTLTPGMTWEDRLRLAETIAPRADTHAAALALVGAAWREVTVVGHRVDLPDSSHAPRAFPSRVAPAARMLSASLALTPTHPLLSALTETVLQQGRAESAFAWNTQDYSSVVIALAGTTEIDAGDRVVHARGVATSFVARPRSSGIDTTIAAPLTGMLENAKDGSRVLRLHVDATAGTRPVYYALEVEEVPLVAPVTPDINGIVVERWYERFEDGTPIAQVKEGDLVRVRLKVTVPADRAFVALEDPLPAGLEPIDVHLKTSAAFNVFSTPESERAQRAGDAEAESSPWQAWLYGSWDDGHWSPWEYKALHDDRVSYFARVLWTGTYTASYIARATTAGNFVAPPAHAEELYNPALQGRSAGTRFEVIRKP